MKKRFLSVLFLLMLVLLPACGVTKHNVSAVTSGAVERQSVSSGTVFFSAEETRAMSNYMLGNRFIHHGKVLYGSRHDETGQAYLCRMKFTASQKGLYVRETEPVEMQVDAQYLALNGDWIYYLREKPDGSTSIARISSAYGASVAPEVLYDRPCDFLSVRFERLYFTDASHHLLSMAPDGGDMQTVLSDKEIYYPFLLTEELLLYQDDADGESLHMRYLPTGFDLRLSAGRVYGFILQGSDLYFLKALEAEGEKCRLCRLDLNSFLSTFDPTARPDAAFVFQTETATGNMGAHFSINGEHLNACNGRSVALSVWETLSDDVWEAGCTSACQYVSKDFEIYYHYNSEGLITEMLFYEPAQKRPGYIEYYRYQ